jgi:hypothetical protein
MRYKLAVLALILIFLVGCSGGLGFGKYSKKKTADTALIDAHKGTQGITLRFMQNQPPHKVFSNDELDVLLEVRNRGAFPATGFIYLGGYDPSIITGLESVLGFDLEPKTSYSPDGGIDFIGPVVPGIFNLPPGSDRYEPMLSATACYYYETEANPSVCIDPKPFSEGTKACVPTPVGMAGGQGAPVAISNVIPEMTPKGPIFKITLSNVGGGDIISWNFGVGDCRSVPYKFLGEVYIVASLNGYAGNCKPLTPRLESQSTTTVYCSFENMWDASDPATAGSEFLTQLQLSLRYIYRTTAQQRVSIRNLQ